MSFNHWDAKTPEERKAISQKGIETRRKNRQAKEYAKREASIQKDRLALEVRALEQKLESLQRLETMNTLSAKLTGNNLLREHQIAKAAAPWARATGVYFLLLGDEVVYVGQSVNIHARIAQHTGKTFDRYAYVPCLADQLDVLESLYIHCLQPKLNLYGHHGEACAPLTLQKLLRATSNIR